MSLVLGIETTCDETAASVVEDGIKVRSNVVRSQEDLHSPYFGVVPEIASRAHVELVIPVIRKALDDAGVSLSDLTAVAVANRPGLIGAILVGVSVAKSLAFGRELDLIGVNHVEAHVNAVRMEHEEARTGPLVGLVASGGHTSLYRSDEAILFDLLGSTVDDAAGEAFDKVAKILELSYPGGPIIDRLARDGNPKKYDFPRALLGRNSLDFSFSGLKTSVLYACKGMNARVSSPLLSDLNIGDVAASFQTAVVDVLVEKVSRAVAFTGVSRACVGGGVACNSHLRERLQIEGKAKGYSVFFPSPPLCADNAAMIAGLGAKLLEAGRVDPLTLDAFPTAR